MGGGPFNLVYPRVVLVNLKGKLKPWVSAKDVILELLRRMTVKGGVGKVVEYGGDGVKSLGVPERATITNMGAELGATTSVFPSDDVTKAFLAAQGREADWMELNADPDAKYDEVIDINLTKLEPMIARPHMPDNVCKVSEIEGMKVDQVCVGSCTNSSYRDLMIVSETFKKGGFRVHPEVSMTISSGSKQVLDMISLNKGLAHLIEAGARILEATCGPCIGNGQSPPSAGVSLRTFNRNFEGRSGTKDNKVYLCSPRRRSPRLSTGSQPARGSSAGSQDKDASKVPHRRFDGHPRRQRAFKGCRLRGPNIRASEAGPLRRASGAGCL